MKYTTTALAMILAAGAAKVQAQDACTYDDPAYTCNATGDGIDESDDDNQTVNITEAAVINDSDKGVKLDNGNTIINDGEIDVGNEGIEVDNDNTITNNGSITSDGDHGIKAEDDNTITNSAGATITAGDRGIEAEDDNTINNDGLIDAGDQGIEVKDSNTITIGATGTIESGEQGIKAENDNTITHAGLIDADGSDGDGMEVEDDNNITISEAGSIIAGRRGIHLDGDDNTVTNSGSILSEEDGIDGDGKGGTTIVNNGVIESTDRKAIDLGGGGDGNHVTNNGQLISDDDITVQLSEGEDTFVWQANSDVSGEVHMGDGSDLLEVEAADVIGSTTFRSLEDEDNIAVGSAAILESIGGDDYILHTGSPTALASSGYMVGALTHNLTHRLLNFGSDVSQDFQVPKAVNGLNPWWVMGGASYQADSGHGFSQQSQNLTFGRDVGSFDIFVGYENATAEMIGNSQSVDQQMLYVGAMKFVQLNDNVELKGLAILGGTSAQFDGSGGTTDGSGMFGSVAGRLNYATANGYVLGTYVGYSVSNLDELSFDDITFDADNSESVFGGFDVRSPTHILENGAGMNMVFGLGFQNGYAGTVAMSAGGTTINFDGADTEEHFGMIGVDFSKGAIAASLRVRASEGASANTSLWIRTEF